VKPNHVLVFGGTSDALELCRLLEEKHIRYTLSVATPEGKHSAQSLLADVIYGRMGTEAMRDWISEHHVDYVIDAAHPYAQVLRQTIVVACSSLYCPVMRYERPSTLDRIDSPSVIKASNVMEACRKIETHQQKVLLTTGSKELGAFKRMLPNKTLYVRVLPVVEVISECQQLGLGIENIIAMKGPFSKNMNHALYEMIQPDVVITKESGQAGGFSEKVEPCIALGIPCIVIERPKTTHIDQYISYQTNLEVCRSLFDRWQHEECSV
jgi:precorrin-6A/cobalt-precorrin-6A reductase